MIIDGCGASIRDPRLAGKVNYRRFYEFFKMRSEKPKMSAVFSFMSRRKTKEKSFRKTWGGTNLFT